MLTRRTAQQRLAGEGLGSATEVVRLLTCVQSQEAGHAFWSLGMRSRGLGLADVQAEFDAGRFVRTHILRPTWHFVAAEDLHWILALTSPRVQQLSRGRARQLDLSPDVLDRGNAVLVSALGGGRQLTRPELGVELAQAGIANDGQRLAFLVMNAELAGLVCSGAVRGAQHTYALAADRVPPTPPRSTEEALGELVRRFFCGHGPASVRDVARWSSLTVGAVTSGLELVRDRLERHLVDGQELWSDPDAVQVTEPPPALLVPLYDELTLSYPQLRFPLAPDHPHPVGTDQFIGSVLLGGIDVGTWRRTVKGARVEVETRLAPGLSPTDRAAVADAVVRLAAFLGLELQVVG